jgi:hypothetical protein
MLLGYSEKGVFYRVCPGDCTDCRLCKVAKGINIVFPEH